jgi:uncharacterized delta-60 repeat protein
MRNHGRKRKIWGVGAVIAAAAAVALAAGGSLDATFGSGGVAWTDGGHMGEIAVQADGKVVAGGLRPTGAVNAAGQGINEWVVRRLDANGSLDAGFGTGGLVRLFGTSTGGGDLLEDLDLDASGRIVAVGMTWVTTVTGKGSKRKVTSVASATLVRLNANGSLDTTFGAGGVVKIAVPGTIRSLGSAVLLEPDGRIVIVGNATWTNLEQPFAARCLANGSLDTSFGSGGISVDTRVSPSSQSVRGAALQSTGHIVFGKGLVPDWIVSRFLPNGAVDTGFNSPPTSDFYLYGLAVDRFDRIVATGRTLAHPQTARVRRYLADGSADASFGVSGVATIDSYAEEKTFFGVEFQSDDRIVFGLSVATTYPSQSFMATTVRLNDDGSLDSTYGTGGHSTLIDMGADNPTFGWYMDIAPDGRIVLAGPGPNGQWFFARYNAD